jgi:hypothetical protein
MAKVQVSHRLDESLLAWATEYGGGRGSSRAVVIEEALRAFRELAEGGVPNLPPEPGPKPAPKRKPAVSRSSVMGERQARLAKELGWGAGPVPGVRKGS